MTDYLIEYGDAIGFALTGVLAVIGLVIIQLVRRRGDVKKARTAVRLVTYSIVDPRPGPIAVRGTYRGELGEKRLDCGGQRVVFDGPIEVVRGTRGRWKRGVRTYALREGDEAMAIGVMSQRADGAWSLAASPGEDGIQLYAAKPRPAPPPLFPWRALLGLVVCGGIAYGALYEAGALLVDVPRGDCSDNAVLRLQISAALPQSRSPALAALARCAKPPVATPPAPPAPPGPP